MNNKSHDFYLHKLLILREWWTWSWGEGCFDILGVRSKITVKASVYWVTTFSVDETYILKMEFIVGDEIGRFICEDYNILTKMICLDHGSGDF